jgi:uncharacterized protein YutE (UPF0331/DUF86 family)
VIGVRYNHRRARSPQAQRLTGAAGLRNIIVHQYVEIDITKILDVIRHDLGDLERFAHELGS